MVIAPMDRFGLNLEVAFLSYPSPVTHLLLLLNSTIDADKISVGVTKLN
jgi:hypothetical protein